MKTIQDSAALSFIAAMGILTVISILGIWNFFDQDVIIKSFETLGLLGFVSVVVMVAGNYIGDHQTEATFSPNPVFRSVRRITLGVLIIAVSILALFGVLAIWEIVDRDVLFKTFGSLGVIAFAAFVAVITCYERERGPKTNLGSNPSSEHRISFGRIIIILIVGGFIISALSRLLGSF